MSPRADVQTKLRDHQLAHLALLRPSLDLPRGTLGLQRQAPIAPILRASGVTALATHCLRADVPSRDDARKQARVV